jgi:hypothetical protein
MIQSENFTTIKRARTTNAGCFLVSIATNSKRKEMCKEAKQSNKEK